MTSGQDEDDDARLEALIERSSLGAPGARELRARIPLDEARRIAGITGQGTSAALYPAPDSASGSRLAAIKRIGLWGPPGSGKSTYLAALNIAAMQSREQQMQIYSTDDSSAEFLKEATARIVRDRVFPGGKFAGQPLSWNLRTTQEIAVRGRLYGKKRVTAPVDVNLDLLDEPGARFSDQPAEATHGGRSLLDADDGTGETPSVPGEDIMGQLSACNGFLLLFDPTREWRTGDMFGYFEETLLEIARRQTPGRANGDGRLPHYVAVCVTKFDHPDVYRRAKRGGYRSFSPHDPYLFPRVPDDVAEQFFVDLVRDADRANAQLVPNALRRFFWPERVKFFVTSAIGFHLDKRVSRFQEQDSMNLVPRGDGAFQIRGPIHPINVVEPLLWLTQRITAQG